MEVLNDLLNFNNMKIYQRKDGFNFSLDSVILGNFISVTKRTRKIIDLGTGNAPVPLILSTRTDAQITGIEIQKISYDLAKRSVEINNLENQITIINEDIKNLRNIYASGEFDNVSCNPPFFKVSETPHLNDSDYKTIARHEVLINLEQIIETASYLLNNNGYFTMVHRPERLIEIIELLRKNNLEPKRMRLVYPYPNKEANILVIEARKCGNEGLKILPPLYSHKKNGEYTEEIMKMFGGE